MDEINQPRVPPGQHYGPRWKNPLPSVALVVESITVAALVEGKRLHKLNPQEPARRAAEQLEQFDFDVAPLDEDPIAHYVERVWIAGRDGPVSRFAAPIDPRVLIGSPAPLSAALELLTSTPALFVLDAHNVIGVVTPADIQLAPVGLYTLGLVVALESAIDVLLRRYASCTWRDLLTGDRLKRIDEVYLVRRRKNAEIDLISCLNLDDRERLAAKVPAICSALGFSSGKQVTTWMAPIKELRNVLAHGGSVLDGIPDPLIVLGLISGIRKAAEHVWDEISRDLSHGEGDGTTIAEPNLT